LERDERLEILKGLPKVELHRHLEGALRIGTMLELGRKYNLNLPLKDVSSLLKTVAYNDGEPRTLAHFLRLVPILPGHRAGGRGGGG
jgi:adenosine deaminase